MPARRNKWSRSAYIPYAALDQLAAALRAEGWEVVAPPPKAALGVTRLNESKENDRG
jgi:hypothetical protein